MIYVVTMAYSPPLMLEASLKRLDETIGLEREEYQHVILDQFWPKDQDHMKAILLKRIFMGDVVISAGKNLGLSGGFLFMIKAIEPRDDDVIIAADPDTFGRTYGWGRAFADVLKHKVIGWVSLWNSHTDREILLKGHQDLEYNGYKLAIMNQPVLNSISAFSGYFINRITGPVEDNKVYGGFETTTWRYLTKLNLKWVFLKDYYEDPAPEELVDQLYRKFKFEITHGGKPQVDFSEWLKTNG